MADISKEELKKRIEKILKHAELANTSTKKVIQKLEADLKVDLSAKRKLIDELVMEYVDSLESEEEQKSDKEKSDEEEEEEVSSEEEKPAPKKRKAEQKKKAAGPKAKKAKKSGGSKGNGYTKACKLSPALSELMGEEAMPRHEVVKRMWGMIKEKNLYDPNNKRFVICDKDFYKVFGTNRFRAFGMMKYLKTHFLD